jgi:hypothetical protein
MRPEVTALIDTTLGVLVAGINTSILLVALPAIFRGHFAWQHEKLACAGPNERTSTRSRSGRMTVKIERMLYAGNKPF